MIKIGEFVVGWLSGSEGSFDAHVSRVRQWRQKHVQFAAQMEEKQYIEGIVTMRCRSCQLPTVAREPVGEGPERNGFEHDQGISEAQSHDR